MGDYPYTVTFQRLPEREDGSAECVVCDETMMWWSHTLVPSFTFVARAIQAERYGALGLTVRTNAQVASAVLEAMRLSARGYHRVLRVARTSTARMRYAAFT